MTPTAEHTAQAIRERASQGRARFASALTVTAGGTAVGVGAFTFSASTERWIGFGAGAALLVVVLAAFAVRGRGTVQRLLDVPVTLVSVWLIVSTRVVESSGAGSSPHSVKWLSLSAGAMLCGAGLLGLLMHEWTVERDLRGAAQWSVRAARPVRLAPSTGASVPELTLEDRSSVAPRAAG